MIFDHNHHSESFLKNLICTLSMGATLLLLNACGSDDSKTSQQPVVNPEVNPIVNPDSRLQQIALQALAAQGQVQVQLERVQSEPIFENREVPSTCTRTVQQGSRRECQTEFDRVCRTENEQRCRMVDYPVCRNVPETICRNVPEQQCRDEVVPVCRNETRNVCESREVCRTEDTRICDSRGCRTVPRRVCSPARNCRDVTERVCHNETRRHCQTVERRQCRLEDRQVCHNESRRECSNFPREICESIPRQACRDVPVYGEETYACTRTERVQVGERVRLKEVAMIRVEFKNPRNRVIGPDTAEVSLENGRVVLLVLEPGAARYRIKRISSQRLVISDTEVHVQEHYSIEAL